MILIQPRSSVRSTETKNRDDRRWYVKIREEQATQTTSPVLQEGARDKECAVVSLVPDIQPSQIRVSRNDSEIIRISKSPSQSPIESG